MNSVQQLIGTVTHNGHCAKLKQTESHQKEIMLQYIVVNSPGFVALVRSRYVQFIWRLIDWKARRSSCSWIRLFRKGLANLLKVTDCPFVHKHPLIERVSGQRKPIQNFGSKWRLGFSTKKIYNRTQRSIIISWLKTHLL